MAEAIDIINVYRTDTALRNKVAISTFIKVDAIVDDGQASPGSVAWATQAYQSQFQVTDECLIAVLEANQNVEPATQIGQADDSVIDNQVSQAVDLFVGAGIWPTNQT